MQAHISHLLHIESFAGMVLMLAAAAALIWANSAAAPSYFALWHAPVALTLGPWSFSTDLHFIVNDVLMTVFFLVVGMEIRRELHNGALASLRRQGVLILGSGLSYHNLRQFGQAGAAASHQFDAWLRQAMALRRPPRRKASDITP
mgnify:CR=1 FL=1